ncbi:MAG: AsmA-like C-terminal region-containing protein [Bacteroidales bacterium]
MKKVVKILLKSLAGLVIFIFLLLLVVPVAFKKQIREQVIKTANNNLEAQFTFSDFRVSMIRHFPNFTFSLKEVYITGIGAFEGDTIAGLRSFSLVFDLSSVVGKGGYKVKSILVDEPVVKAVVLEDGSVSWDIMKAGEEPAEEMVEETDGGTSSVKLALQSFQIRDAKIQYIDRQSDMSAGLGDLDLELSGNMSAAQSDLMMAVDIGGLDFTMGGINYISDATAAARIDLKADLENSVYELGENSFTLNEITFFLTGKVAMEGESIITDLSFSTGETGFKELLSMVPAFYMQGYEGLKADGTFGLSGDVKGIYNSADSVIPSVTLDMYIKNGMVSYPDLPEKISAIAVKFSASVDGTDPDRSVVNLEKFHFELAGNPFDASFRLVTPLSDPGISGGASGRINLTSLSGAVPMEGLSLAGLVEMGLSFAGNYSMVEAGEYERFRADGSVKFSDLSVEMDGLPPVAVKTCMFSFSPRYLSLEKFAIDVAGSDFALDGQIDNYIAYVLRDETIKGKLSLNSSLVDAGKILSYMPEDTTATEEESTSLPDYIIIPGNIDFIFASRIGKLLYPPLEAANIRGNIIVRDGTVIIEDTGLEAIGGKMDVTALYDTRDTLNPLVKGSLSATGIGIKAAFETFNTVKKLAPVAEGMAGDINVAFDFSSTLGKGMMPVTDSITGRGKMESEQIELVSSPIFEKFSSLFKLDDSFTNTFNDVAIEFRVENGRVYIKPFNTKMGVIKMVVSGDHGLDQTLNYVVKSEMPSKYLPESMKNIMNTMAAQAAVLGLTYNQPEVIKVNLAVGGTVKDPMIMPTMGGIGDGAGPAAAVKEVAKEAAEKVVEDVKERVSDEISKEAEKIIAEAEEKADLVRKEASTAAAKIRQEAEVNAVKLIDEAASKGSLAKIAASKAADALRKEADKKATQLETEADRQATAIIEEAKKKAAGIGKN